ncbi:hypothetical protein EDC01DRAFT_752597 [Geopyxis carbonaria]|nr:hypothetical protein EDC01DRAFT_752597 [Geopyxis carbonaria]
MIGTSTPWMRQKREFQVSEMPNAETFGCNSHLQPPWPAHNGLKASAPPPRGAEAPNSTMGCSLSCLPPELCGCPWSACCTCPWSSCCTCPWSSCCAPRPPPPPRRLTSPLDSKPCCRWPWSTCCAPPPPPPPQASLPPTVPLFRCRWPCCRTRTRVPATRIATLTQDLLGLSRRLSELRRRGGTPPELAIPAIAKEFWALSLAIEEVVRESPSRRPGDEVGTVVVLRDDVDARILQARVEFGVWQKAGSEW